MDAHTLHTQMQYSASRQWVCMMAEWTNAPVNMVVYDYNSNGSQLVNMYTSKLKLACSEIEVFTGLTNTSI